MSYGHLKEKEQALSAEIDALIKTANRCDREEDRIYKEKNRLWNSRRPEIQTIPTG